MTINEIIEQSLAEDIGSGDVTTLATIPAEAAGMARLLVKDDGILCGVEMARRVFAKVDPDLKVTIFKHDGAAIHKGDHVFEVTGRAGSILQAERLVLNFMQRMSGIATATHRVVRQLEGLHTRILDTRKTTPLLRELEKYAVKTGGGENHRFGLYDMVMIKDNHADYAGGIIAAIDRVHAHFHQTGKALKLEVEVRNFDELHLILEHGGVDRIMLDNFRPADLKKAVTSIGGRFETEASGGINPGNVREYAETGVDFISMGSLTHQITSLDMSLKATILS